MLFDTQAANKAYYNHVLAHFNRSALTIEQFDYVHMHTVDAAIAYLFKDHQCIEAVHRFRESMCYTDFLKYMKIEPHLIRLLEKLNRKYKTAIATNRSDTMELLLVEFQIKECFDLVVTSLDVGRAKPHPDPLLKILDHFGIRACQALYIGDSQVDELASAAAGIPFIAYDNMDLTAKLHIRNLKELYDIL
ncbi:MAG: HAD-IA family hydrolase [Deltaproteobacteria bacterium]|nr:HAD-IA family hydrolase [Deltaproteobacteria bacterium]